MAAKPAKPHKEHVLIIKDDKGTREYVLEWATYSIGRSQECSIRLHSQFVSRHHATLLKTFREDGSDYYRIVDGDDRGKLSVNGLLVEGNKVSSYNLKDGDKVVFGPNVFAIYQHRHYDVFPTIPPDDPFDITLIDPAMMINDIEEPSDNFSTQKFEPS
jgi:pSer/pThr/pTyr-binding forkhead associated (FHA) protein